jgi:hypothetical protein
VPTLDTDRTKAGPTLKVAIPILLVRDVTASADFFRETLGFEIDFSTARRPSMGPCRETASACTCASCMSRCSNWPPPERTP